MVKKKTSKKKAGSTKRSKVSVSEARTNLKLVGGDGRPGGGKRKKLRSASEVLADIPDGEEAKEVDALGLSPEEARKRCDSIYMLERGIERKRAVWLSAKAKERRAKTELSDAENALAKEIHDQRFGPGPLFPIEG